MIDRSAPLHQEPDLQGRLGIVALTDILQLLSGVGASGTLSLAQGWNGRTILFDQGRIVFVASVTPIPDTAALMVAAGRLDPQIATAARKEAERSKRRLEDVLASARLATEDDLKRCYNQQLEELLYTFFLWRECWFTFRSDEQTTVEEGITVELSTEHVVLEGVSRVDNWIAISPIVPSVRLSFQRIASANGLEPTIQRVYDHIDASLDVASLAKACGMTQFECAKALYNLGVNGIVRAVPPNRVYVIELFTLMVESIFTKLELFNHFAAAREFMAQLNAYARLRGLKVTMQNGKVALTDLNVAIETTELIDQYRTFVAVQMNKFYRTFAPDIARGLLFGLYQRLPPELQKLMVHYDFGKIEGLFDEMPPPERPARQAPAPLFARLNRAGRLSGR
jgi:hypothetical protein